MVNASSKNPHHNIASSIQTFDSENIKSRWGTEVAIISRIIDSESGNQDIMNGQDECVLIGATFKEMTLRSSVIDEIKDGYNVSSSVAPLTIPENFASKVLNLSYCGLSKMISLKNFIYVIYRPTNFS